MQKNSLNSIDPRELYKISKRKIYRPTHCAACKRPAGCCHYGVPCCNGCKTFFRRYLRRYLNHELVCQNDKSCDEKNHDYIGKDYCRLCRIKRCLEAGMIPEAVGEEDERSKKAALRKVKESGKQIASTSMEIVPVEQSLFKQLDELLYVESKFKRLRESTYHPKELLFCNIREILLHPTQLPYCDKYEKPPEWPLSMDRIYWQTLEYLKNGIPEQASKFGMSLDNVLIIDAAKTLPFFKFLDLHDQTIIMRHTSLVNTILMECFYSFINHQTTIVMPDGTVPLIMRQELNKLCRRQRPENTNAVYHLTQLFQYCRMHKHDSYDVVSSIEKFLETSPVTSQELLEALYIRVLDPLQRVNLTEKEYVLLKTLIYCRYTLFGLSEHAKNILQKEFNKHAQVLLKYLQVEYGELKGAQKYAEVISLIGTFFNIAEKHKQIFLLNKVAREDTALLFQPPKLMDEIMNA